MEESLSIVINDLANFDESIKDWQKTRINNPAGDKMNVLIIPIETNISLIVAITIMKTPVNNIKAPSLFLIIARIFI